jgi:hypothetical protein
MRVAQAILVNISREIHTVIKLWMVVKKGANCVARLSLVLFRCPPPFYNFVLRLFTTAEPSLKKRLFAKAS